MLVSGKNQNLYVKWVQFFLRVDSIIEQIEVKEVEPTWLEPWINRKRKHEGRGTVTWNKSRPNFCIACKAKLFQHFFLFKTNLKRKYLFLTIFRAIEKKLIKRNCVEAALKNIF